jgi:hypothetical protein
VVTFNKTGLFQYGPETKQQSLLWKSPHSRRPNKARISKYKIKAMLIIFFNAEEITTAEYVTYGQTMNQSITLSFCQNCEK